MDPLIVSWVLYAVRETLGLTIVRNKILKTLLKNQNILYGNTFSTCNCISDIYSEVMNFLNDDTHEYLIFTANNSIGSKTELEESHYQTFIITKKKAIMIDPSRNNGKQGIYYPGISIRLEKFFKRIGLQVEWLEIKNPCQDLAEDVFCQSWTLYLVICFFEKINCIPANQYSKYELLLNFLKKCLDIPIFRKELKILYNETIRYHNQYRKLSIVDPCSILRHMNTIDMYDK